MSTPSPVAPVEPATPLPWHISPYSDFHIFAGSGDDETGVAMTDTSRKSRHGVLTDAEAAQNAAYLCAAANAYPQLVEALKNQEAAMEGLLKLIPRQCDPLNEVQAALAALHGTRAALALALKPSA